MSTNWVQMYDTAANSSPRKRQQQQRKKKSSSLAAQLDIFLNDMSLFFALFLFSFFIGFCSVFFIRRMPFTS